VSEESQRAFLSRRVKEVVQTITPAFPMAYPNLPFDPPKNAPYGRMFLLGGKGLAVGKDGEKIVNRKTGILQITIYTPAEKGTAIAAKVFDKIIAAFENYRGRDAENVPYTFKVSETRYPDAAGGWHQCTLRIPYFRDERQVLAAVS
jgi:hypothetical protein